MLKHIAVHDQLWSRQKGKQDFGQTFTTSQREFLDVMFLTESSDWGGPLGSWFLCPHELEHLMQIPYLKQVWMEANRSRVEKGQIEFL